MKEEKNKLVAIIILNWNGIKNTKVCLDSLLKIKYPNYKIIVIDNNSYQNEAGILKHEYKNKIDICALSKNLGFTGGVNLGINYALDKYNPDYFLILNNDTKVTTIFLSSLIETAERDKRIGIVSPVIKDINNQQKTLFSGGDINYFLARPYHTTADISTPQEVTFVTGCSFLLKRTMVDEIGLLDNRFFAYFEDAAYSTLAQKHGYKCYCDPHAIIYHKESSSLGKKSILYTYLFSRNRILFARHYTNHILRVYYYIFFLAKLIVVSSYFFVMREENRAKAFFYGYLDGMRDKGGYPTI